MPIAGVDPNRRSINAHDIAADRAGRPVFANTLFNCIATTGDRASFVPLWSPPFITDLVPEDRCHLNGLALEDGRVRYVTALSTENREGAWRTDKTKGCLIDVARNAVAIEGLSMPHSPRIHGDRVWLHNSGTGEFGTIENGAFAPAAFLPGYLRGLAFVDGFAVMTL
jgi:uncharacterized protein (TIGR03032 family)